jgi:hypothetical protein
MPYCHHGGDDPAPAAPKLATGLPPRKSRARAKFAAKARAGKARWVAQQNKHNQPHVQTQVDVNCGVFLIVNSVKPVADRA